MVGAVAFGELAQPAPATAAMAIAASHEGIRGGRPAVEGGAGVAQLVTAAMERCGVLP
ncbi:MAG TPA: hypothetical protein VFP61_01330 [Acidimicrobiales bacterium]|nr:hypothetical protein [Acidimicrobiales bacterium]